MPKYDIVVLTEDRYANPTDNSQYVQNLLFEDQSIINALQDQGFSVIRKSWSDPAFDWSESRYGLFRTTWDYFDRFNEFMEWMDKTAEIVKFINSAALAKWNLDKHYLQDLNDAGLPVVPTKFVEPVNKISLREIMNAEGLQEAVIKPAISGAGRHTYRVKLPEVASHEEVFAQLTSGETMLVQPFIESILEKGEISLMIFGGSFSHAVLKIAKPGDFRVQDDFGGTVHPYEPDRAAITLAEQAVGACPEIPLYARVDLVWYHNSWHLGELELIEPELFFRNKEGSAQMLAKAIADYVTL
jgi:glutathione synthase/RimK-type ligase-like ATP-grasp enzyme